MSPGHAGLALAVALAALSRPSRAAADGNPMRIAARLEAGAAGGWSGRGVVAGEAVATVRLGPLVGVVMGDLAGPSSDRHPAFRSMLGLGAGLAWDVGGWEASGTALLVANSTTYPDLLGTGRTDILSSGLGLRGAVGRYLGDTGQRGRFVRWAGLSATVAAAGPTRLRIQDQRQTGFVALLSVTVGVGLDLPGLTNATLR